jgi:hemolysin activation/secretion protein
MEYRVEGNSVLPAAQIEETVYPYLGERMTYQDVEKARAALEKAYRDAGYLTVFVDIPEQDVGNGIVRLTATEGKVGRLRVNGSRYYSLGRIRQGAPSLVEGAVPHFPTVQKEMADLNRSPDRRIAPVLKAGKTPGTVDVELKVDDTLPLHASLELNDRYSADTTHLRLAGMVRYDNLWQREHSVSFQFQTSPENTDEVKVLSANYLFRPGDSDNMIALYGVYSHSNVATIGGIGVLGNGHIYGARLILPLPSLDQYSHSLTLGADYKRFDQTVLFGSDTSTTPISYTPFSVLYNATLQAPESLTELSVGVNFSLRGLGNKQQEFEDKRSGARADYLYLKADIQHTHNLPAGLSLFAHMDGQLSGQPLISNEQFSAGGVESVRGYLESEVMGDSGLHATLELRSPQLLKRFPMVKDFHALAFIDGAHLYVNQALPGEQASYELASAGFGMQLRTMRNINANIDVAWPQMDAGHTLKGDVRAHARVWYEF